MEIYFELILKLQGMKSVAVDNYRVLHFGALSLAVHGREEQRRIAGRACAGSVCPCSELLVAEVRAGEFGLPRYYSVVVCSVCCCWQDATRERNRDAFSLVVKCVIVL